jgi:hypothetical protein
MGHARALVGKKPEELDEKTSLTNPCWEKLRLEILKKFC